MSFETIIILSIICGNICLLLLVRKWIREYSRKLNPSNEIIEWLKSTNQRLNEQNSQIVNTLELSTKSLNERLDNAAKYISSVQKNIGEMSEMGRGIRELQEFIQNPKLRGNLGEQILTDLLSLILPRQSFMLKYTFKSGMTIDAVIKTSRGIIPIDSKFPLENYRKMTVEMEKAKKADLLKEFLKDVKKHIDDISNKYILLEEGTIDYALMYIPGEPIYYEVINSVEIFDYAVKKKVLLVSPTTLFAYLRTILISFEGYNIEKQAQKILFTIKAMQKDYLEVEESLGILNRHLTNAFNQLSNVFSRFTLLGQKIASTKHLDRHQEVDK